MIEGYLRVIISRIKYHEPWRVNSNPTWDSTTIGCSHILNNAFNEYAEYLNAGVTVRMVRVASLDEYGINPKDLDPASILTPSDIESQEPE